MKPSDFRKIKDKPIRAYFIQDMDGDSTNLHIGLVFDTHILEIYGDEMIINIHKLVGQSGGSTLTPP